MNSSDEILNLLIHTIQSCNLTEKECLKATNINTSFLTDWKKGKIKAPAYDKIVKLAEYLDLSLDFLFLGKGDERPTREENASHDPELVRWLSLFYSVAEDARPFLIHLVMKEIESVNRLQAKPASKKSSPSANIDEHCAAKIPENSNIA